MSSESLYLLRREKRYQHSLCDFFSQFSYVIFAWKGEDFAKIDKEDVETSAWGMLVSIASAAKASMKVPRDDRWSVYAAGVMVGDIPR